MRRKKGVWVTLVKQCHIVGVQIYVTQVQGHMCVLAEYYHALGKTGFLSKAKHRNGRDKVSQASLVFQVLNDTTHLISK